MSWPLTLSVLLGVGLGWSIREAIAVFFFRELARVMRPEEEKAFEAALARLGVPLKKGGRR